MSEALSMDPIKRQKMEGWTRCRAHQELRERVAALPETLIVTASRIGVHVETLRGWIRLDSPHKPGRLSRSVLEEMFAIPKDAWISPKSMQIRPAIDVEELNARHKEILDNFKRKQCDSLNDEREFWTRERAHQAFRELVNLSPLIKDEVAQYLNSGTTSIDRWKCKINPIKPTDPKREVIEKFFGIPFSAWDR